MPLTREWISDPIGDYTKIAVDDIPVCGITDLTSPEAVDRFWNLCLDHEAELTKLCYAANERREWNIANKGKGRDWPAFRAKERFVNNLLAQAGIKDS